MKEVGRTVMLNMECPDCHASLNAAKQVSDLELGFRMPEPGDLTVCMQCGCIGEFNTELAIERAKPENIATLDPQTRAQIESDSEKVRTARMASMN